MSIDRSVDGTLIKAWASMKNFQPRAEAAPPDDAGRAIRPNPTPPHNRPRNARSRDRPDAPLHSPQPQRRDRLQGREALERHPCLDRSPSRTRLYKKPPGTGAILCFMGHVLMENRSGLIVQGGLTRADGHAERCAALEIIHRPFPRLDTAADAGCGQGL